jgi:putative heme-binding domain-containing protein
MDGWLYCANGWSGGQPRSVSTGRKIASFDRRDLRIQPDTGTLEAESGMSEFGRDSNDWGDWFGCDNSHPLFHFVLSERYLRRFTLAPLSDPKVQVIVPANPKVFPVARVQRRFYTDKFGYFTSACSATIYRDELLFGGGADEHMFVCEPAYNLVHHEILREDGVSYLAARPTDEQTREFLASDDQWFRPVMTRTGPDGALWIVDMYRYMIEHPDWLPPEGKKALAPFYRDGAVLGRIYRIYPKGHPPRPLPRLDRLSSSQLVAAMDSPNGTLRDMVQKQILWRADSGAVTALQKLADASANPAVQIQAMYTAWELGRNETAVLSRGLHDHDPAVRRNAIRLCEEAKSPELVSQALKLVDDPDPKVRLQLACSLGEWEGPEVEAAVRQLAARVDEPYLAAALISGGGRHMPAILESLEQSGRCEGPLYDSALAYTVAADKLDEQKRLLRAVLQPDRGTYSTAQLLSLGYYITQLAAHLGQRDATARARQLDGADAMFEAARRIAADDRKEPDRRAAAVRLLGRDDIGELASLLTPKSPGLVQTAAVASLARTGGDDVPPILLRDWASRSPQVRTASLDVLLSREAWTYALLRAAEDGTIPPADFDSARRERLLNHRSARIKSLAQKVMGKPANPLRQQVIDAYRAALNLDGDAKRGTQLFAQNCATCHRKDGSGADIGPDLNSVAAWQSEALLTAILDPSREVQPQYLAYTATLSDGDAIYGLIVSESGDSVTMKGLDGKTRTLLRTQIKSLAATNRSLMPDGLEFALTPQGLADVIRYLQTPSPQ